MSSSGDDRSFEPWQAAASAVGGTIARAVNDADQSSKLASITATLGGVAVQAVADEYSIGVERVGITRLTSTARGAGDLILRVYQGRLYSLSRSLGDQELKVGEPDFDRKYVVKSNDATLARLWLNDAVRQMILGSHDPRSELGYRFEVHWGEASARRAGFEASASRLEHAIRAVAALGRRGADVLERCQEIARRLGGALAGQTAVWRPDGTVAIVIGQADETITIDHISRSFRGQGPELFTRIRRQRLSPTGDHYLLCRPRLKGLLLAHLGTKLRELSDIDAGLTARYWIGGEELSALTERLSDQVREGLLKADPRVALGEPQEVSLWFSGFEDDLDRLRDAIELVTVLGSDVASGRSSGPYR